MKKLQFTLLFFIIGTLTSFGQVTNTANWNVANVSGMPDTTRPWATDKGARTVHFAGDLDNDGKPDFVVTDYTNGGRVHVLELTSPNTLELVWSSPTRVGVSSGSTPRWVRSGDLDGDGFREIIFPLTTTAADFQVQVFEYQGTDNNYGTEPAFVLPADYFAAQGVGNFRTNREVGEVNDFDNDGLDELVMTNRDNRVYVLGVFGQFPGFASWQIEAGLPSQVPKVGAGSHWHSIAADINGDGTEEIVSHFWNNYGFFSIRPTGADTYAFPDTAQANHYVEFFANTPVGDAVAYMGVQRVDVNGDGKDEIAGILYGGLSEAYSIALIDLDGTVNPLYAWDPTKAAIIGRNLWQAGGDAVGSFWGIGAADLNGNGREEILLGGSNNHNLIALEYKGTGSLLDENSYDAYVVFSGPDPKMWGFVNIYDSLGVIDTTYSESAFIAKMHAGFKLGGKTSVVASYQSVYDSVSHRFYTYNVDSLKYLLTNTVKVNNPNKINVRIFESTSSGIQARELNIITPDDYTLDQNYPNPFNPSTTIRFSLPVDNKITLKIYDILGNQVANLIQNEDYSRGSYEVVWDGKNSFGQPVASGNYIAELKFGNFAKTIKMTMLK